MQFSGNDDLKAQFLKDWEAAREIVLSREKLMIALGEDRPDFWTNLLNRDSEQSPENEASVGLSIETPQKGKRNERERIRAVIALMDGPFIVSHLRSKARESGDPDVAQFTASAFSGALKWLEQKGMIKREGTGTGGQSTIYKRVVEPEEILNPANYEHEFPLKRIVIDSIRSLPDKPFGRAEVFEAAKSLFPEHAEQLTPDTVGAVMHRLADKQGQYLWIAKREGARNIYEKVPGEPGNESDMLSGYSVSEGVAWLLAQTPGRAMGPTQAAREIQAKGFPTDRYSNHASFVASVQSALNRLVASGASPIEEVTIEGKRLFHYPNSQELFDKESS